MQSNIKQLFYYIKPSLHYFTVAFIAVLFSALTILLFGKGLSNIIDSGAEHDFITKLLVAILIVLGISLTAFIRLYFIGIGSEKVIARIRYDLYSSITDLQPSFFENTGVQDVISALITDTSALQSIINSSLLTILRNFVVLTGSVAMLLYTNLHLTAYAAAIIPILLIVMTSLGKKVRNYARFAQDKLSELASFSEENFRSIVTIKSFVLEENEKIRFQKHLNSVSKSYVKLVLLRAILVTLVITCVIGSLVILLFFGIKEVLSNNITIGELSSFVFYSALAAGAVNNLSDNVSDLQRGLGIVERLFEFTNMKSSIVNGENPIRIDSIQKEIAFNDVTFFYADKPALNNVSFSIEAGQSVSIVGPSGSGKSTILKLLLRFHDPSEGSITIDGQNIKTIALNDLRSLFGLVPQDHMIFSCSIMENILYGKPDAEYEEVKQAAISAYAIEFIDKLPDKFDTFVGKRGLKLSEGQKQRIIIARAILKNPQVLILDEATSALDYKSENLVQKALSKLMQNRTTIIITHRLSTALKTDKIIVINCGKVEEVGTHDSLMSKDGLYTKLAKIK
ncbi:ATP-binding cassette domain-containing protein [Wolbachia endosymbiont of Diaphorina citri]|jgi:ABC-type multidrug transport system, ATPase and permease components|uniref:ABC transporter ATP-binding protein n=1 Tax=Wolbachia endosymbiont of Diaphorina citri TaxID=116598 RepID=UPI0002D53386|nr:ABC transporter transmembrane domain-containing protein [Wolbachia endosymbiont of Diaphorina citri]QJT94117.1 ATP-binding cassette domain-containing protein [Wolbachia endosymbiont of Diaphorina citri]QJT95357.1 ATP-binding cassette domain-containing protein [Wolbachia endosymbiont of Diaphorina citri]QJT96719.1 ATP-binding cassette domain-containing protein [Wolbachia endosymbiont of Diaphorina citri]QLK11015.1 ATP-binding cassette domain-containing protein [Wolbachia endosymbiont of Diaph